ncbi:MATE family efflux transporter [Pseudodesulfovibrio indicus]|uniref:MATE family efflux transporter n=1 Tax=Pseudodesulfovibrio indicus TaxID=1716143 RepID=A0A126QPT8_9BACT|nr:MATE family efflux transporter [Pseudodesulfovibrio indicus]TDT87233.1 MATE family multidrug resistance protein [Pseudodesulfovibrio indicus]
MRDQAVGPLKQHPFLGKPNRTLVGMAVPVLFSLVAEPLTGLADTAFVARLPGSEPVAALGVGTVAFTSIFWAFTFLGIGTQTEVAHAEGGNDHERAVKLVSLACFLAGCIGVAIMFASIGFLAPIAGLFGAEGQVNDLACDYMYYRLLGAPAVLVTLACFGGLRGVQDMRTPLYVAVGVNVVNVFLDWALIFGNPLVAPMGVAGAAIASTISQWIGAVWCLEAVRRSLGLTWRMRGAGLARLMRVGGDLFVRTGAVLVFLALCTRVANRFGSDQGAAFQAIRQFFIFSALFLDAFAITGQSLVGWFLGAGDRANARRVASAVCWWSFGTGVALCVLMLLGSDVVAWLLVPPSAHAVFGPGWIVVALSQPIGSLSFATDGIHWGAGDFGYLRNVMLAASIVAGACVLAVELYHPPQVLVFIWLATALWTFIRAGFGLVRIWPGVGRAPLNP